MKNLLLFTGEETFLLHEHVNGWKKAFLEKHGDINLIHLDGAKEEVEDIVSQIEAMPFLGEKRLIFIDNIPEQASAAQKKSDKQKKKDEEKAKEEERFLKALEGIPNTSVVVFIQPKPDKRKSLYKKFVQLAEIKEFKQLSGSELNQWVRSRALRNRTSLDIHIAEYLISQTGQDLWRLESELQKLSAYLNCQPVTKQAIDNIVNPTIEANIFRLTDALGAKDRKSAIQNLHRTVQAGDSLSQVFYMIVRQFRLFLLIGGYISNYPTSAPATIASALKIHSFVAKNTAAQLKRFHLSEIKQAYQKLLDIDIALKTGGIRVTTEDQDELAMEIEKFILGFCG